MKRANLTAFIKHIRTTKPAGSTGVRDFTSLYRWSVEHPEAFWPEVWRFCGVVADERPGQEPWDDVVIGLDRMAPPDQKLGPRWFPGARLNFAENLLRYADDHPAIEFWNELGRQRTLTYAGLSQEVARVSAALREHGIVAGDRVAGFLPNLPETVIAMLATTSLGAIWSSCSPDFGANGVVDRFGQIRPRVLFCADGYRYAGKVIDSLARVREVRERIPEIERVVVVPYVASRPEVSGIPGAVLWADWRNAGTSGTMEGKGSLVPSFHRSGFDHPIYILYSSGTTGLPKCMVHGAGGTLLQHLKELVLHTDLRREDRIFYFTTCGWMMWNWLVSSLAVGADRGPVRRGAAVSAGHPLGHGRRGGCDHLRHQREVSGHGPEGRPGARAYSRPHLSCVPFCPPAAPSLGTATTTSTAASSPTCTLRASAAAPTSSPASHWATRLARYGGVSCRAAGWG